MVKGYELADCFYGRHRFRIAEVRAYPNGVRDGDAGVVYAIYDAETVTDAEVAAGIHPTRIATCDTFAAAIEFCDNV
jgi:hypothetical protein